MQCVVVADAGSSKIDWAIADVESGGVENFSTPGINAVLATEKEFQSVFITLADKVRSFYNQLSRSITSSENFNKSVSIFYYGSGCATPAICEKIKKIAQTIFPLSNRIDVRSDLDGAGIALFGDNPGLACILGTGSNSGYYDGRRIIDNIPSLGYILGDEGSGSALGKRFINRLIKGPADEVIYNDFKKEYHLDIPEILNSVYNSDKPNVFLASFVPFLISNRDNDFVKEVIYEETEAFFNRNIERYELAKMLPIGFVGSIGYFFKNFIKEALVKRGLQIGPFVKKPISQLLMYHLQKSLP